MVKLNKISQNGKRKKKKNPAYFWAAGVSLVNATVCAAESQCQEAEAAYEKQSSRQGVKAFIIITNLQAPPEPAGTGAAKQTPAPSTFHHCALEGWKQLS